ncbi:YitT family protein [Fuchsiella alkaliacetigena]|uniref:YitT family protein n=1 Tax=Fuchsiella alkaliacetigena TaxID=957042 RepID=UPI00200B70CA|nr:YitT family protein [Fuchsiella alkaliacetigena]MCK8824089.1 YitT family protein [Fuchsiella alkaliacetigena]
MLKQKLADYLIITLGAILVALGLIVFLVPARIAAGGVSGIATIVYHVFDFPVGMTILLINVPLFMTGVRVLGFQYGIRGIYGTIVLSLTSDLLAPYIPVLTTDPLLSAIYGGVLIGIGLGIVFKYKGSTGGTSLVAQLVNHYLGLSVGKGLLIVDILVITSAAVVFSVELALYGIISLAIASKTIDLLQDGFGVAKGSVIISKQSTEIKKAIFEDLDRGVTVLTGRGGFTDSEQEVLLCIIRPYQVAKLKSLVCEIDEEAFVVITDVHEVFGEGFV